MEVCRQHTLGDKCLEIYGELDRMSKYSALSNVDSKIQFVFVGIHIFKHALYFPDTVEIMQRSSPLEDGDTQRHPKDVRNWLLGIKSLEEVVELLVDELKKTQKS